MDEAKIQLSADELELVKNANWILTKNTIMSKVYTLFGILSEKMKIELEQINLTPEPLQTSPKISRGENYNGLPYVILDYPRLFTKNDVFAIRTLFWWANYFSVTLHLKGKYKNLLADHIRKNLGLLSSKEFYLCISKDEWMHELDEMNYVLLSETDSDMQDEIFARQTFLKVSVKISLNQWNGSETLLLDAYRSLLQSLHH